VLKMNQIDSGGALDQQHLAAGAEQNLENAYQGEVDNYKIGTVDLQDLLWVRINKTTATIARIRADQDLNQVRVSLQRLMIQGPFTGIRDCRLKKPPLIFKNKTVDEVCR